MGNRMPMHAVLWGIGLAVQAAAKPAEERWLGDVNRTLSAFAVATILGAVIFKLLTMLGERLGKSSGRRGYYYWLTAAGAAVWGGIYLLAFMR